VRQVIRTMVRAVRKSMVMIAVAIPPFLAPASSDAGVLHNQNLSRICIAYLRRLMLAFGLAAVSACSTVDYVKVRYVEVEPDKMSRACPNPRLIGTWSACAVFYGDVVEIRAPRPQNVADHRALAVIGHEFYCHAWLRMDHFDAKGVRREPRSDCVLEHKQ
jgi:hypothetical protein